MLLRPNSSTYFKTAMPIALSDRFHWPHKTVNTPHQQLTPMIWGLVYCARSRGGDKTIYARPPGNDAVCSSLIGLIPSAWAGWKRLKAKTKGWSASLSRGVHHLVAARAALISPADATRINQLPVMMLEHRGKHEWGWKLLRITSS